MKKIIYVIIGIVMFLAGCSAPAEPAAIPDEYVYCSVESFSNNGYFYLGMDEKAGLHFADPGNHKVYDLAHHQMEDDETFNPVFIGFVSFYDGKILYSKLEEGGASSVIYACSPDGTNETRVAAYTMEEDGRYSCINEAILCRDHLYFSLNSTVFGTAHNEEVLCDLDLKTGKTEELTEKVKSNGYSVIPLFVYENSLYFNTETDLDTNEFSDTYILYKYDIDTKEIEKLNDQLPASLHLEHMPENEYIYFNIPNTVSENGELHFLQYNLKTNEITEQVFTYETKEGERMYLSYPFAEFARIRVMTDDGSSPDMIFYNPQTGKTEYFSSEESFIPSRMNSSYILGYQSVQEEGYLGSIISKEDFANRDFSKAVRIMK